MKIATQSDIDSFFASVIFDENIYPYITTTKYTSEWKAFENDWNGVFITNASLSYLTKISFDRTRGEIEFSICLFAKNPISAGRAVQAIKYMVNRYKPKAINSVVHSTNEKSLQLNRRIFGGEWGVEPLIAWDAKLGKFVDLHYFRKLLNY